MDDPKKVLYDAEYYAKHCGVPYAHNEHWLGFFGSVADHIVKDLSPKTVFDAGCAWGILVECLRVRGIDAWGMDISEFAINMVQPEYMPYCRVGSILDPLDSRYDLITCIEVLEHLSKDEGTLAIKNLCQHTDTILFTSTPSDLTEPTHQNVQQPEYWEKQFSINGFVREKQYDASYLTSWAMLFKRANPWKRFFLLRR